MERKITGFHQDEEMHWVADLACGHTQHVRHDPPWQNREWVIDAAGREAYLGNPLDCLKCDMARLPDTVSAYKQTPVFDQDSVPKGLLKDHATKAGVWGKIVILEGELQYVIQGAASTGYLLDATFFGIVEPEVLHYIKPNGTVRFYVEFYR